MEIIENKNTASATSAPAAVPASEQTTPASVDSSTAAVAPQINTSLKKGDIERMRLLQEDTDFITDSKAAVLAKSTPLAGVTLYILAACVLVFIVWASLAKIDEFTRGIGKVVPTSQVQIIQSLEGGILEKIYVKEGEVVKKGEVLAQLDPTSFAAEYREGYAKYLGLQATMARLIAETENKKQIIFPAEVLADQGLAARENNLFNSRQESLQENMNNLQASYKLALDEKNITEPLVAQKVVSKIELLRLQRDIANIKSKMDAYQNEYYQQALTELSKSRSDIAILKENLIALKDRMERTTMRSPVDGVVKQLYLSTVGGVLKPAVPIMEVVPVNDELRIEARVSPSDIGFVKVGDKALVKITAFDYSIYGGLDGRVTNISADTSTDERGTSYYEVDVKTQKNNLGTRTDGKYQIVPGMIASVDIVTGKKTLMHYLLKPILRGKERALRER